MLKIKSFIGLMVGLREHFFHASYGSHFLTDVLKYFSLLFVIL